MRDPEKEDMVEAENECLRIGLQEAEADTTRVPSLLLVMPAFIPIDTVARIESNVASRGKSAFLMMYLNNKNVIVPHDKTIKRRRKERKSKFVNSRLAGYNAKKNHPKNDC